MHRTRFFLSLVLGAGLVSLSPLVNADLMLGTQVIPQEGGARADSSALARGRAALRARNFEQAEKAFSEAYRQNPSSVEAMLGMAAVSHMQGKEKLARDWMSSAVAMAPGQPAVLQAQARLLVEQGLPAAQLGTALGIHAGMAVHESQSRLWENQVARSRGFWRNFEPRFRALFPAQTAALGAEAGPSPLEAPCRAVTALVGTAAVRSAWAEAWAQRAAAARRKAAQLGVSRKGLASMLGDTPSPSLVTPVV